MKPKLKLCYDVDGNLVEVIGICKAKDIGNQFKELKKLMEVEE